MLSNYLYAYFFSVTVPMLLFLLLTLLFLCASVCGRARAFYMNFTIRSIDDSLFGTSCDVYSLKSVYMARCTTTKCCLSYLYICSFLFFVTVPMLFFLIFLLFPCASGWGSARARVPHFL